RLAHRIACGVTFIKQDIGRFDFTMDYTFTMGVVDGCANRCKELHNISSRRKHSFVRCITNIISEGQPFYIVHHHVSDWMIYFGWTRNLEAVDLRDIRMVQRKKLLRLL